VTRRFVAQISGPSNITDAGVRVINALAVNAADGLLADITTLAAPTVVADALGGRLAVAVGAVGADGDVAEGSLPTFVAVAVECIHTRPVFATRHDNAL
jgi:hypothetical protein